MLASRGVGGNPHKGEEHSLFASQPWPYPCGLMVGFIAEYDSGEIQLQRSELNKGGWYSRDNMPAIPGEVSLARHLIDHWLAE